MEINVSHVRVSTTTVGLAFVAAIVHLLIYMNEQPGSSYAAPSKAEDKDIEQLIKEGSSILCTGEHHTTRMCRVKNLCYSSHVDSFIFLHGQDTFQDGLPSNRFEPTLLDLSSVYDHSKQYFNFVDVPPTYMMNLNISLISQRSLIFNRFHPGNIMHVVHDDLFPLYHTLKIISHHFSVLNSGMDTQLVFWDDQSPGEYNELYKLFSNHNPIYKLVVQQRNETVCFRNTWVGISKQTIWYQYGFKEPQGPLFDINITCPEIIEFTLFLKKRLNITIPDNEPRNDYILLLSRKANRLILNELQLVTQISQDLKIKIKVVSLETHTLIEIIEAVSKASGLLGMHGSLLILAMFLPKGAFLLELFPYAINPNNYTPYKTLMTIMGKSYGSWVNADKRDTITHPGISPEYGGINQLPAKEQAAILESTEVKKHLCCNDPEWLFRIYQDTLVNLSEISDKITTLLKYSKYSSEQEGLLCKNSNFSSNHQNNIFPSAVVNLRCTVHTRHDRNLNYIVMWEQPWNVQYTRYVSIQYEIWIQRKTEETYDAYITKLATFNIPQKYMHIDDSYNIWVRCILDNKDGPMVLLNNFDYQ